MSSSTWNSPYPHPWSAWQWSDENNIYERAREIAPDNYEWEYSNYLPLGGSQAAIPEATPSNREAAPSPSDLQESYDGVSAMADQFRNASLENSTSGRSRSKHRRSSDASGSTSAAVAPPRSKTPIVQFSGRNATPIVTRNKNKTYEKNNPNFKVHDSKHFAFGKVFKVLWSEPIGSGGTVITTNQQGYQKTRRFVVIDKRRWHSICLPILTYGGQATLKGGAHGEDHAAVYCNQQKKHGPTILEGEKMTKEPIKIDIRLPSEKLDPLSRLNYAKVYTVEHNVKVNFIGEVNRRYEQKVVLDYNATHGPIADRPYTPETSRAGYSEDVTRNSEGVNPDYQEDEPLCPPGNYSTAGGHSQSSTQQSWNPSESSTSRAPRSTGFVAVATASYGPTTISTWATQAANTEQATQPPYDSSIYEAD
ncbi:hypothetical protein BKA64DRAFT_277194 [Cadophora sp. MPI-SDFR-AT-0126]|nr:hypothetical protein BKA64DRAFT_277194 [Leotiomycetes sp. MPI-SDFR-AT-0126]